MTALRDWNVLPDNLPVPQDDGAARHLQGYKLPSVPLAATDGSRVDLSKLTGRVVVYVYPRTGRPG
ncbi:MAG: peroxiredoxin, partial [Xanthobacteraceae bacterium]|nr:peroxiredoxin [Xanthobacteraceae bacterium]